MWKVQGSGLHDQRVLGVQIPKNISDPLKEVLQLNNEKGKIVNFGRHTDKSWHERLRNQKLK